MAHERAACMISWATKCTEVEMGNGIDAFRSPADAGVEQLKQPEEIGQVAAQYGVTFVRSLFFPGDDCAAPSGSVESSIVACIRAQLSTPDLRAGDRKVWIWPRLCENAGSGCYDAIKESEARSQQNF